MSSEQCVGWDEIDRLATTLSEKILSLPKTFQSISTLSRGGLVPSRLLADHLGIKKIYVDEKKISPSSLFVDDIFDSGDSFKNVLSRIDDGSNLVFATLFARNQKKKKKKNIPNSLSMLKKPMMMAMLFFLGMC